MRRHIASLFLAILVSAILSVTVLPSPMKADIPYETMSRDSFGNYFYTQSAYLPVRVIGRGLYEPDPNNPANRVFSPLKGPKDVFVDSKDEIYIADTGNNRIVHLNDRGELIRTITTPQSPMKGPQGLFIAQDGFIYVADTGNQRVLKLGQDGAIVKQYTRPKSTFLPDTYKFDPLRLVVDKRGFLYIATIGGYQGMLQLDPDGNFQGFFGANKTTFSFADTLKRFFYTREMLSKELSKLPGSVSSVAVDKDGFLYTTTTGVDVKLNQIKKLNYAGQDMLAKADAYGTKAERSFGELRRERAITSGPQLVDVTVDREGNITAIDSQYKYVNQYDAAGNLLFFWSGSTFPGSVQLGVVRNPVAIDSNSKNELFILDDQEGIIQMFRPSEFGQLVHQANALTLDGKYEESEQMWREVLKYNAKYTPALLGVAKSLYKRGDYSGSSDYFFQAGNQKGFSDAYWQIRLQWFQKHFAMLANVCIGAAVLYMAFERLTRKAGWRMRWRNRSDSTIPFIQQLKHMRMILTNPIEGFTALRYENKGGYGSALFYLAATFVSLMLIRGTTSFSFNKAAALPANYSQLVLQFAAIWLLWVVASYLIGSILQGEARFKDVFISASYGLIPIILVGVPLAFLSNGMTQSEQAIYDFFDTGMLIWIAALFFWKVQSIQNYGVGETVLNIATTVFTMIIFCVLIAITVGLTDDLIQFFVSMYQEVKLR